jgi:hypothetical protein
MEGSKQQPETGLVVDMSNPQPDIRVREETYSTNYLYIIFFSILVVVFPVAAFAGSGRLGSPAKAGA